jgi:RNA polymerase sigma factor (sigma-70 family)
MEDDFTLLEAWRAGDETAGKQLFARHFDAIYRFFDRKVDGDAADLVQRTFLGCVEARDRFRGTSSFRTFLFSIARHELYGHWRQRKKGDNLDFGVTSIQDLAQSVNGLVVKQHEHRLLLEALRSIGLDLQVALELHFWEGMSGNELAEVLDIPVGTVRSRLRRAREALEKRLAQLERSPQKLASTVSNLEHWARSLRDALKPQAG